MNTSLLEGLESRRLLDGVLSTFIVDASGHWTALLGPGGSFVADPQTGMKVPLPTIRPDGSASLEGTTDADQILVERVHGVPAMPEQDFMHYRLAGLYDIFAALPADVMPTGKIVIDGAAGNDRITVATNVPMKTSINGGPGADILTSGKKTTNLYGGSGNDRLISRSEKGGLLDGGRGADRYYNRFGQVTVAAADDGDRLIASNESMPVSTLGVFTAASAKGTLLFDPIFGRIDPTTIKS